VIRSQSQLQLDQGNESSVKIANCLDAAGATLNISVSTSGSYTVSFLLWTTNLSIELHALVTGSEFHLHEKSI